MSVSIFYIYTPSVAHGYEWQLSIFKMILNAFEFKIEWNRENGHVFLKSTFNNIIHLAICLDKKRVENATDEGLSLYESNSYCIPMV